MSESRRKILKIVILAAILILLSWLAHPSCGQDCFGGICRAPPPQLKVPVTQPHPAVVHIVNITARARENGSGTLVKQDGIGSIILTCGHIFSEGTGRIIVSFPDGKSYQAKLLGVDRQWDLG
ncbi:unnamed protein product, partial [marine sediment metagenome]